MSYSYSEIIRAVTYLADYLDPAKNLPCGCAPCSSFAYAYWNHVLTALDSDIIVDVMRTMTPRGVLGPLEAATEARNAIEDRTQDMWSLYARAQECQH